MKLFSSWDEIPTIYLDTMDRKIFTGENVMLVRNEVHPKEELPLHDHPHEQLFIVESGECDVYTEGQTKRLKAGGLTWFRAGQPHKVTNLLDEPLVVIDVFSPIREDFLK